MTQTEKIRYIRDHLSEEDILCQLAEEAAELAQAALKLRRAMTGTNPTPIDVETAQNKLSEEIADVALVLNVMKDTDWDAILAFCARKLDRWVERLKDAANTNCAAVAPTDTPTAGDKTRQEGFLEMFPRADAHTGVLEVCPGDIDIRFACHEPRNCDDCRREYWLTPAKEEGKNGD